MDILQEFNNFCNISTILSVHNIRYALDNKFEKFNVLIKKYPNMFLLSKEHKRLLYYIFVSTKYSDKIKKCILKNLSDDYDYSYENDFLNFDFDGTLFHICYLNKKYLKILLKKNISIDHYIKFIKKIDTNCTNYDRINTQLYYNIKKIIFYNKLNLDNKLIQQIIDNNNKRNNYYRIDICIIELLQIYKKFKINPYYLRNFL